MSDTTMSSVSDVLARFLLALDDHDWDGVTAALGETVRRDYTSLFGGEPDDLSGAALTAEWRGVLAGLDGHQHLLGMPAVDVETTRREPPSPAPR
jgi:SnoaL-like domain